MAKRARRGSAINPAQPDDPYKGEKGTAPGGDGTYGQNVYSQGGQHGPSGRMPWPGGAPSDGGGDEDEDLQRRLPRNVQRGDGSSGRYG